MYKNKFMHVQRKKQLPFKASALQNKMKSFYSTRIHLGIISYMVALVFLC